MSIEKFAIDLERFGFTTKIDGNKIEVDYGLILFEIEIEEEWLKVINKVYKSKQFEINKDRKYQVSNNSVEFQIFKLTPSLVFKPSYEFTDSNSDKVVLSNMSKEYHINLFIQSEINMDRVKKRLITRFEGRPERIRSRRINYRIDDLFMNYITITYIPKSKLDKTEIVRIGREKCKASLFKLAVTENECWELRETIKAKGFTIPFSDENQNDLTIPKSNYDEDMVGFYKVARSSIFPTQSFLSYYHVLEYNFLRVADEELHSKTKSIINSTTFNSSYENVNKLLSVLQKHERNLDETSMLKRVLTKFIDEEELIGFITDLEDKTKEKIFSRPKDEVFGERISIKLEIGHAISNTSKVIKHIRNSLVHSGDKYTREECVTPFSESESIVIKYIPVIKYLAEKIIYANAK